MPPIVECIPNFSEGRRAAVIAQIVAAIDRVRGVRVLHQTSDSDHNRTVVTFAGTPTAVLSAAFDAIRVAADVIDMDAHRGVHPRIGATDVVPLVPIADITLAECADLARQLGARVGRELALPVYLYEAAATTDQRRNLAHIRRGEYEALKQNIDTPERHPDFGAPQIGKAGAVAIGARSALIAYNVYLNSDDVRVARHIARTIRQSNGGFVGVKALGLQVDGRAQVSMNLTDYKRTPVHLVLEAIRREAARYGVLIAESELIGLMPQDALWSAAAYYLQLHDFTPDRILEQRLNSADFDDAPD